MEDPLAIQAQTGTNFNVEIFLDQGHISGIQRPREQAAADHSVSQHMGSACMEIKRNRAACTNHGQT